MRSMPPGLRISATRSIPVIPGWWWLKARSGRWLGAFPLVRKGKQGQSLKPKPVNNARTDKLSTFFWRESFVQRRCLIPLTGWAEAQGEKRADDPHVDICPRCPRCSPPAGVWRRLGRMGRLLFDGDDRTAPDRTAEQVHSRMPVLLAPDGIRRGLGPTAEPEAALTLCRAWDGPLAIDRTGQPWARGRGGGRGRVGGKNPRQPSRDCCNPAPRRASTKTGVWLSWAEVHTPAGVLTQRAAAHSVAHSCPDFERMR